MRWSYIRMVGPHRFVVRYGWRQFAKRVLRRDLEMALPNGVRIGLPRGNRFASEVFVSAADVDWGSEALMRRLLEPGGVLLDVGAHIGYYSLYMSDAVTRAYAFEPNPRVLPLLEANAARARNIEIVRLAVSDREGEARFDASGEPAKSHLVSGAADASRTIEVRMTTLDAFMRERPNERISGIKVDVEGFDLLVLRGARETIVRDQPIVLTEFSAKAGENSVEDLLAFARELDYAAFAFFLPRTGPGLYTPRLMPFEDGLRADMRYKMIFLVPARLRDRMRA